MFAVAGPSVPAHGDRRARSPPTRRGFAPNAVVHAPPYATGTVRSCVARCRRPNREQSSVSNAVAVANEHSRPSPAPAFTSMPREEDPPRIPPSLAIARHRKQGQRPSSSSRPDPAVRPPVLARKPESAHRPSPPERARPPRPRRPAVAPAIRPSVDRSPRRPEPPHFDLQGAATSVRSTLSGSVGGHGRGAHRNVQ
ncbi:hypothetical protein OF83DRAFT_1159210 [Amylostereum chailletii]|nr:hypothetical protein OF83DRAFT_1159210 [Amylostereum chailletii]